MHYLHKSYFKYHGNLKSSNCLIDSRFLVKLTDYGLTKLRQGTRTDSVTGHKYYESKKIFHLLIDTICKAGLCKISVMFWIAKLIFYKLLRAEAYRKTWNFDIYNYNIFKIRKIFQLLYVVWHAALGIAGWRMKKSGLKPLYFR